LVAQKQAGLSGGNATLRQGRLAVAAQIAALPLRSDDKKTARPVRLAALQSKQGDAYFSLP